MWQGKLLGQRRVESNETHESNLLHITGQIKVRYISIYFLQMPSGLQQSFTYSHRALTLLSPEPLLLTCTLHSSLALRLFFLSHLYHEPEHSSEESWGGHSFLQEFCCLVYEDLQQRHRSGSSVNVRIRSHVCEHYICVNKRKINKCWHLDPAFIALETGFCHNGVKWSIMGHC